MPLANLTARSQRVYVGTDAQEWSFAAVDFLPELESIGESGLCKTFAQITVLSILDAPESIDPRANPARWREGQRVRVDVANDAGGWFTWGNLRLLTIPSGPTDGRITLQLGCWLAWADDPQPEGDRSDITLGTGENSADLAARLLEASGIPEGAIDLGAWDYDVPYPLQKEGGGSYIAQAGALAFANHCRQLCQYPDGIIRAAQWSTTPGTSVATVTVGQNEALFAPTPDPVPPVERVVVSGVGYQPSTTPNRYSSSFTVVEDASNFSDSATGTVGITTTEVYEWGEPTLEKPYYWTRSETRLRQPQAVTWIGSDSVQPETTITSEERRFDSTTKILYRIETSEIANVRTLVDATASSFGTTITQRTITDLEHDATLETLTQITETTTVPRITLTGDTGSTGRFVQETSRKIETRWTEDKPDYWVERTSERIAAKDGGGRQGNLKPTALITQRPQIKPDSRPPATERWEDPIATKEQHFTAECTWLHPGGATGRVRVRSLSLTPGFSNAQCFEVATREVQLLEGRRESHLLELPLSDALLWVPPLATVQVDDGADLWTFKVDSPAWEYTEGEARFVGMGICVARVPVAVPVGTPLPAFESGVVPGQVAPAEPAPFVVPTDEVGDVDIAATARRGAMAVAATLIDALAIAATARRGVMAVEVELIQAIAIAAAARRGVMAVEVEQPTAIALAATARRGAMAVEVELAALWTPAQLTTALWLDASDNATLFDATSGGSLPSADGAIARWEDKSGNARHLTQSTSGNRPIRKAADLNGLDGIRLDGTDDHLFRSGLQLGLINRTIIAVFKENAVSTNAGVVSLSSASGSDFNSSDGLIFGTSERVSFKRFAVTGSSGSSYDIGDAANISVQIPPITYIEAKSSGTGSLYRNGTSTDTDSSFTEFSSLSGGGIVLGGRYSSGTITGNYLNGTYYEIIYCESTLSTDNRQRVEGYVAHKWGTTADLPGGHPYKTTPPYV